VRARSVRCLLETTSLRTSPNYIRETYRRYRARKSFLCI